VVLLSQCLRFAEFLLKNRIGKISQDCPSWALCKRLVSGL
jgi:hypothetical protein